MCILKSFVLIISKFILDSIVVSKNCNPTAFVDLYTQAPDPKYADYVFWLSDHLLTQQNLDSDDEVYGSFHAFPTANAGSYMEGLVDSIHLANLTGDSDRVNLYAERAKMAYRWLFILQYTESDKSPLKHPEMAIGGIPTSRVNPQLRIDNTQHSISAFAKGLRYIFEKEPAVETVAFTE